MAAGVRTADVTAWMNRTDNGNIPFDMLEIVPGQYDDDLHGPARMYPPAAAAMYAMLTSAGGDGRHFRIRFSYRTLAKQWEKWNDYQNDDGNVAAYPGTSNHGDGLSCDLTDLGEDDIRWLRMNARRYGFYEDVSGESWHWTYYGGWTQGMEEDVEVDKYHEGQMRFHTQVKENMAKHPHEDPDPGAPPEAWAKEIRWGWNDARAGFNVTRRAVQ